MPALPEHVRGWSIPAYKSRPPLSVIRMGELFVAGDMNEALTVMDPRHAIVRVEVICSPDVILGSFETSGGWDTELRAAAAILHLCAKDSFGGEEDSFILPRFMASTVEPGSLAVLRTLGLDAVHTADDFTASVPCVHNLTIGQFPEFAAAEPMPHGTSAILVGLAA